MEYPEPTVSAVIFNPEGQILLCKSHKWNGKYVIPGGHIEAGEKMEEALRREIMEETGLKIYNISPISIKDSIFSSSFYSKKHFIFIDFICQTDSYDVHLNDEAEEFIWVDLKDVDRYELGGSVKPLLKELKNKSKSPFRTEIFYGY